MNKWIFKSGGTITFTRQSPEDAEYRSAYDTAPWDAGADIPAEPTEQLIIAGSGGRMWKSEPVPMGTFDALRAVAESALHPTGRCTCGGEGRCAWCQEICERCMGDCYEYPCNACNSTGLKDGGVDYEALGYPETEFRYTPHAFETLVDQVESWWR